MFSLDLFVVLGLGALILARELHIKKKIERRRKWYFEKYLPKKYGVNLTAEK